MPDIFIGYRWTDSEGTPGRIYDRLSNYYGAKRVFQDTEVLRAGSAVGATIASRLASADVMLVVIGDDWLDVVDEEGRRRLDQPGDWVRREVELALAESDIKIIPVLIDGAARPPAERLPETMQGLADFKPFTVRHDEFEADVARLINEEIGGRPRPRIWMRLHPWRVAAIVVTVAAVVGGLGWRALRDPGPRPLTGQLNVAVAEFATIGAESGTPAADLAEDVADGLRAALEADAEVVPDVGGPAEMGAIEGDDPAEREAAAARLAEDVGAQVVVYGAIERSAGLTTFNPEFYLAGEDLGEAEELAGSYPLGSFSTAVTGSFVGEALTEFLEPRIDSLGRLLVGLNRYQRTRWSEAEALFTEAERSWPVSGPGSAGANGKQVVFHLLGNAAGIQGFERLLDARAYYEAALALDPEYARSRFGLAEVQFQLHRGRECGAPPGAEADLDEIAAAADRFAEVQALDSPPLAHLRARAELQIGRVEMCLFLHTRDGAALESARESFERVIADHAADDRLNDLVAEAHASLGGYHVIVDDFDAAVADFRRAIDETASDDHGRLAAFYWAMGRVLQCDVGDEDAAAGAYEQSAAESHLAGEEARPEASCPAATG